MRTNQIISDVADLYGITQDDITSRKRHRRFADARAVICYIMCALDGYTFSEAGRSIHRTHASVIYFVRRASWWMRSPVLNQRAVAAIKELTKRYYNTKL